MNYQISDLDLGEAWTSITMLPVLQSIEIPTQLPDEESKLKKGKTLIGTEWMLW
jgi:hypothetical protein